MMTSIVLFGPTESFTGQKWLKIPPQNTRKEQNKHGREEYNHFTDTDYQCLFLDSELIIKY